MAHVPVSHTNVARLSMLLPLSVAKQIGEAWTDGCSYHLELWDRTAPRGYVPNMRRVSFPESWGIASKQTVAYVTLNAF